MCILFKWINVALCIMLPLDEVAGFHDESASAFSCGIEVAKCKLNKLLTNLLREGSSFQQQRQTCIYNDVASK